MKHETNRTGSNEQNPFNAEARSMGPQSLMPLAAVEPWPEPVDGKALLDAIREELRRFVVLPKWAAETLALWILHTYAFLLRNVSTYIGIESPEKQCGKTTLLTVLNQLVCRPEIAANISPPAFFRVIEETRPTLLIDEGDTFLRRNSELRGILNAGYTREAAYVVRVAAQEHRRGRASERQEREERQERQEPRSRLVRFSCFCPKAIASIGRLPETLADRCVVIRMQRKTPAESCERCRNLDATELRRKCLRFVMDHGEAIAQARPEIPAGLGDRTVDIWEPLLVLADLAGGDWPESARRAMEALTAGAQENSAIGSLFLDILMVFVGAKADRMFSRTLAAGLNGLVGRPWEELRKGKEVTDFWVSRQLRPYGLRPRSIWIEGVGTKGYVLDDFWDVFRRYIPRTEIAALMAEAGTIGGAARDRRSEVGDQKSDQKSDEVPDGREERKDEFGAVTGGGLNN